MSNSKLFTYVEAFFAVIVWGGVVYCHQNCIKEISPLTIVWLRFLMGVVILGLAVVLRKQFNLPDKKEWAYFALLGFLGITFHQVLQSNGLRTSEASTTAWIVSTTPVFMALLGWLILKEGLGWGKTLGILVAFIGVLVVISKGNIGSVSIGRFGAPGRYIDPDQRSQLGSVLGALAAWIEIIPASLMMFYVMSFGWLFTSVIIHPNQWLCRNWQSHIQVAGWGLPFREYFVQGWHILHGMTR